MSKSNAFETAFLRLLFQNIAIPNIGDAEGLQPSATPGFLYVCAHTGDPGEPGTQATNIANYGGYEHVPVERSADGWTVTGNLAENAAVVNFPARTGGAENTITHYSIGTLASGAGMVLYRGALASPLNVNGTVQPFFPPGTVDTTED